MGRSGIDDKENYPEAEVARRRFEMELDERRKGNENAIDEMLSGKDSEFCSRCGSVVIERSGWGGKCIWEDCRNVLCSECFDVSKLRFCAAHSSGSRSGPKRAERNKEDDDRAGDIGAGLKAVLDEHEESRKAKIRYYSSEYARRLRKRMEDGGPIDWTRYGHIGSPKTIHENAGGAYVTRITDKRWFRSRVALSVSVVPYDARIEKDMSSLNALVHKAARRGGGYALVVLVSDGSSMEVMNFVNKFSDDSVSLYLSEPRKGHLNFNIRDPLTVSYSEWFGEKKYPRNFREKLRSLGDLSSGRRIVSESIVAREFGFRGRDVPGILGSCGFLEQVKDTDTYIVK